MPTRLAAATTPQEGREDHPSRSQPPSPPLRRRASGTPPRSPPPRTSQGDAAATPTRLATRISGGTTATARRGEARRRTPQLSLGATRGATAATTRGRAPPGPPTSGETTATAGRGGVRRDSCASLRRRKGAAKLPPGLPAARQGKPRREDVLRALLRMRS